MNPHRAKQVARELQLLNSHKLPNVRFHGMSMVPFLQEGDRVVVEPVQWQDIEPGDIITYRNSDKYPSRRVIRKSGNILHLWCDNWPLMRFFATREEVLGRAMARERDGIWTLRGEPHWEEATRSALRKYRRTRLLRLKARVKRAILALRSKFI